MQCPQVLVLEQAPAAEPLEPRAPGASFEGKAAEASKAPSAESAGRAASAARLHSSQEAAIFVKSQATQHLLLILGLEQ